MPTWEMSHDKNLLIKQVYYWFYHMNNGRFYSPTLLIYISGTLLTYKNTYRRCLKQDQKRFF